MVKSLETVLKAFPNDSGKLREMSLIEEDGEKRVNMAYLAIVGSHAVNGVAAIHSQIIKDDTFRNFYQMSVNLGQENKWQNKVRKNPTQNVTKPSPNRYQTQPNALLNPKTKAQSVTQPKPYF